MKISLENFLDQSLVNHNFVALTQGLIWSSLAHHNYTDQILIKNWTQMYAEKADQAFKPKKDVLILTLFNLRSSDFICVQK